MSLPAFITLSLFHCFSCWRTDPFSHTLTIIKRTQTSHSGIRWLEKIALHTISPDISKRRFSHYILLDSRWQCMQTRKLFCLQKQKALARRGCTCNIYIQDPLNSIIIGGGASQSVRIAHCHSNSDDSKRQTQQHGHASVLAARSQCDNSWSPA